MDLLFTIAVWVGEFLFELLFQRGLIAAVDIGLELVGLLPRKNG